MKRTIKKQIEDVEIILDEIKRLMTTPATRAVAMGLENDSQLLRIKIESLSNDLINLVSSRRS